MTNENEVSPEGCALCGSTAPRALEFSTDERFGLRRCGTCGLLSTAPALPTREIGAFYPKPYYGSRGRRFAWPLERLIDVFRGRRARLIERHVTRGSALDVGCGRGLILARLRSRGWTVLGIELSEDAAEGAKEAGVPVRVGAAEDQELGTEAFDAVVVWHVLEHLREPKRFLRNARRAMRPGGLLLVAVPNSESWQARITRSGWFHLDVPRHYHHFGRSVLARALESEGFAVERVSHFCFEQNLFGWIQSLFNAAGLPRNQLYAWLRTSGARSPGADGRFPWGHAVATAALAPFVLPLSVLGFALEAAFRRGGTIEILARAAPVREDDVRPS